MNQAELDAQFEADIAALIPVDTVDENLGLHKSFKRLRKSVTNLVKNPVKSVTTAVKRYAPAAIGAAALWYGAPYALTALKAGGSYALSAAKGLMGGAKEIGGATQSPVPASSMISPQVIQLATDLAKRQLRGQGINMQSPQANMALNRYVQGTAQNMQYRATGGPDYTKFIVPAVAAGGALLMLKG